MLAAPSLALGLLAARPAVAAAPPLGIVLTQGDLLPDGSTADRLLSSSIGDGGQVCVVAESGAARRLVCGLPGALKVLLSPSTTLPGGGHPLSIDRAAVGPDGTVLVRVGVTEGSALLRIDADGVTELGRTGGTPPLGGSAFGDLVEPRLDDALQSAVLSRSGGADALYVAREGLLTLVHGPGGPLPEGGTSAGALEALLHDDGAVSYRAASTTFQDLGTTHVGELALFRAEEGGSPSPLVAVGDPDPDDASRWFENLGAVAGGPDGTLWFGATTIGAAGGQRSDVFVWTPTSSGPARAPHTTVEGDDVDLGQGHPEDLMVTTGGGVSGIGLLSGAGITGANDAAWIRLDPQGPVQVLAREGEDAPGIPGVHLWNRMIPGAAPDGTVALYASISQGYSGGAIWVASATGDPEPVVVTGQPLAAGDARTVARIDEFGANEPLGGARSVGSGGRIVGVAQLSDTSEVLFASVTTSGMDLALHAQALEPAFAGEPFFSRVILENVGSVGIAAAQLEVTIDAGDLELVDAGGLCTVTGTSAACPIEPTSGEILLAPGATLDVTGEVPLRVAEGATGEGTATLTVTALDPQGGTAEASLDDNAATLTAALETLSGTTDPTSPGETTSVGPHDLDPADEGHGKCDHVGGSAWPALASLSLSLLARRRRLTKRG